MPKFYELISDVLQRECLTQRLDVQGLLGLSAGEKLLKKVLLDVQLFKEQVQDRVVALLLLEVLEGPVRDQVIRTSTAPKSLVGSITAKYV